MEERGGSEAGPLAHHLAVAPPPAVAPVLDREVVALPVYRVLGEAVALDPAPLLGMLELGADLRGEPVEEVEEGAGIPSHQRAGQRERPAAGLREHARGDALRRTASLELVDLVAYEEVEEAPSSDV